MNRPVGQIPVQPAVQQGPPEVAAAERPRVLLVDDDERNLLAVESILDDLGEVVTAKSGEEALRHLLKGEFAVILLDVYMPVMDGYEAAQIIRSRDQTKGIPIVFLSAVNKEAEHLLRGYSMGAVDYVFKPVDPIVLRSKVSVFVDLFAKTKEIEIKAQQQKALLDANLKANAERLRVERELRFAEQRQAAIIQALPIVLYVEHLDEMPRVPQYVAGNFESLTGFTKEKVAGEPQMFLDRLHPDDHEKVRRALDERLSSGTMSIEYRWRHADGKYRHFLDQTVELPDEGTGRRRVAGTFLDVTDRRELESQLVHAQKMDAIGKLTGGIAHDFNNLLAAVIGGLSVIERRMDLQPEQQRVLDMTKRAAEQGSELVRRLLAFARRQKLEPQRINLAALREAVSDLLTHTLGGLVNIEWRTTDGVWDAFADQTQLELALVNLIINARDAMPDGGTVTISAENKRLKSDNWAELQPGEFVLLTVSDTGTGMAPDLLEKVMEPFFTTKGVGKGSGLGLSMVYGFANQSGGAFRLKSEISRGTTAELWLPRAVTVRPKPESAAKETLPRQRPARRVRILLVDDHAEVRSTTAELLQELGHEVAQAANGNEALDLLRGGDCNFGLMISDYAMPQISGTEFLRQARELCPGVPALIITGYAEADAIRDRPEGVQVLQKPFTPTDLDKAIARVCGPALAVS
jgi:PAS domain S-box-containing protein